MEKVKPHEVHVPDVSILRQVFQILYVKAGVQDTTLLPLIASSTRDYSYVSGAVADVPCRVCNHNVWLAPSSKVAMSDGAVVICWPCVKGEMTREVMRA
jgi:hypothetical protein